MVSPAERERHRAYWRSRLTGWPALALPADGLPADPGRRAQAAALPPALGEVPAGALLAAFAALLARASGAEEVALAFASRADEVLLRVDLSGAPGLREIARRAEASRDEALAHAGVRPEELVRELDPSRDLERVPLVTASLSIDSGGHRSTDVALRVRGAQLLLEHACALWHPASAERFLRYGLALLEGGLREPDRPFGELALIDAGEESRLVQGWSGPPHGDGDQPHQAFSKHAARAPGAVAVVDGARTISYRELDALTDRLARRLRREGAGPEARVGVCAGRSLELVAGALSALKAGAAYVPLDPDHPGERLRSMMAGARSTLALASKRGAEVLARAGVSALAIDLEAPGPEPAEVMEGGAAPESLAYVIYTSGSTGPSKGVMIERRAISNFVRAHAARTGLGPGDRVLLFSSPGFDQSVEEYLAPLSAGAAVVVRTEEMLGGARPFFEACGRLGVTFAVLPTAFFHQLSAEVERGEAAPPRGLRLVELGGERASPERVAGWLGRAGGVALFNSYGPTEFAIASLYHRVGPELAGGEVPLGTPIAGTRAYVLDRRLRPVPWGLPGELFLAGANIGRGYLEQPALTAERFLPDPHGAPGERMYRTGDLCRWRWDGTFEFLGRADDQVKIRGYRVQPAEVESALGAHPDVSTCAVVAREHPGLGERLVAYVVSRAGAADAAGLRRFLGDRLPEFMVPATFIFLAALPLNQHGKVDRRGLPAPKGDDGRLLAPYAPPERPEEARLAGLWTQVLGVSRVGRDDHFLHLGGDSLLLARLQASIAATFRREPSFSALLTDPTLAGMWRAIEAAPAPAGVDVIPRRSRPASW